jgi:diguanylate cyclase (GGDEF)-like protein/PAS domain S-box-containing protein
MVNEFIYPDGSSGWFELSIQPVPDGIFILSSDITGRKLGERALLEREMKLSILLEILPVGISILDAEGKVTYTNPILKEILDLSEEELFKGAYRDRKYLRADGTSLPYNELTSIRAINEKREIDGEEIGVVREDGSIVWVEVSAVPVDFPDWKVVIATSDITERKQAELAVRESEERYKRLFENMQESFIVQEIIKDDKGNAIDLRYLDVNPAAERSLGRARSEIIGRTRSELSGQPDPRGVEMANDVASTGKPFHSARYSPGFGGWFESFIYPLGSGLVAALSLDITERKLAEEEILKLYAELEEKIAERTAELAEANKQLHELAIVDELTGLYNRRGFLLHAEQQLLLARRAKYSLLVFYADLDGLKSINDGSSHAAGDQALIAAATALRATFRTSDIVARLGGDEFVVLAMEAEEQTAQTLAARLRERLTANGISMSVGVVSIDSQAEESMDAILGRADQAMYADKRNKPNHRKA